MPTCYGQEGSHAPTEMESTESEFHSKQYECPKCGVTVDC